MPILNERSVEFLSHSPEQTRRVGVRLGEMLHGGHLVCLDGDLGSGKTTLTQGIARGWGALESVTSPTFVLVNEYHRADTDLLYHVDAFRLATPEFVEVTARDGFVMDAMLIRPPDFDPARRYPVYQLTYAGPGNAQVRDQWGGGQYLFHQLLAQHGVIVWILDNRSASGKGAESQWPVYGRLGELELQDLEDGVSWLKRQRWVDASRIVLSGWSYGGFMTAYAMTHSTSWSAGVIGAPVTDWRDYDTIYTERLMKMPQHNEDGYERSAPRFAADRLHGRILLVHGTLDDNVHMQNSMQFAYELQKAGKSFELMVYPKSRHSLDDARLNLHMRRLMFDFVMRAVGLEGLTRDSAR